MPVSVWMQILSKGQVIRGEMSLELNSSLTLKDVVTHIGKTKKVKLERLLTRQEHITVLVNHQSIDYGENLNLKISDGDTIDILQHIVGG